MTLIVRQATDADAPAMAGLINEIIALGGTTAFTEAFDAKGIADMFVARSGAISCFAAFEDDRLLGFQSLFWRGDYPGAEALPEDWALIGTYVRPGLQKKGVGRALFAETRAAAAAAGVAYIDATIRRENAGGQAFYGSLGFEDYSATDESVSKRLAP